MTTMNTDELEIHACPAAKRPLPLIERAYELARIGKTSVEIRAILNADGYDVSSISSHLRFPTLKADLNRLANRRRS